METILPILFASLVGMGHAFEADHLLAVSNIVSKRDSMLLSIKDGFFWGLGHTTTIVIVGSIIILSRATFFDSSIFEAVVGGMLIIMGISRLTGRDKNVTYKSSRYQHSVAYSVGLVHGLAGSGALVLLVMSEIKDVYLSIAYLLVFGIGSILGMFIAAGLFSIPFSQRMVINKTVRLAVTVLSSVICILYGGWMIYQHI